MKRRILTGVTITIVSLAALSVPVAAVLERLTTLPLGKGTATITWANQPNSLQPGPTKFSGSARSLTIKGVNRPPHVETQTGGTLPAVLTVANISGTIGGAPFTVKVSFLTAGLITPSSVGTTSIGQITGTFRNQPISASLGASIHSNVITFQGHIGSDAISGTISGAKHKGKTVTAHATFDLTR